MISSAPAGRLLNWSRLLACNLIWPSQFVMVTLVQEQLVPCLRLPAHDPDRTQHI